MSYRVRTDSFEGPFDLLLYLVSRDRVDIGSLSIAGIADQYLDEIAHLQDVDLDVASDFLLVAATLLEIKAQSLIPRDVDEVQTEIAELAPDDARELLVGRLLDYKKYKNAAAMLEGRQMAQERLHDRPFGPDQEFLGAMPDFLRGVTLDALAVLAADAYARREIMLLESEHIAAKPIPVEARVRALGKRIADRKHMRFSEMCEDGASVAVVVVTFLAVLELYKRGMVRLDQDNLFGEIEVSYIEGSETAGSSAGDTEMMDDAEAPDPAVTE